MIEGFHDEELPGVAEPSYTDDSNKAWTSLSEAEAHEVARLCRQWGHVVEATWRGPLCGVSVEGEGKVWLTRDGHAIRMTGDDLDPPDDDMDGVG